MLGGMAQPVANLTDQRFGRLTVLRRAGSDKYGQAEWLCRCECGTEVVISCRNLRADTRSCGCLHRERTAAMGKANKTHGLRSHRAYDTWSQMRRRCHNPRAANYQNYGGRGITVCDEWRDSPVEFIAYVDAELGPRPEGHSLDRIDNDGNYEPGNIRWADNSTQMFNRRGWKRAAL